jgi:hypothetical protein
VFQGISPILPLNIALGMKLRAVHSCSNRFCWAKGSLEIEEYGEWPYKEGEEEGEDESAGLWCERARKLNP